MMTSHLGLMMLFAGMVAVVFAALLRDDPSSQVRFAVGVAGALVVGGWLVGWMLYLLTP
jgi:undecaprenyl pyrophosphate phosphatase UppP